jgi:hypothetical protein
MLFPLFSEKNIKILRVHTRGVFFKGLRPSSQEGCLPAKNRIIRIIVKNHAGSVLDFFIDIL